MVSTKNGLTNMLTSCFSKRNLSRQEKAKVWVLRLKLSSCCSLRCWVFVSLCVALHFWPVWMVWNSLSAAVHLASHRVLPLCPFLFRNIPDPNMKRFSFKRGRGRRKIKITKMRWAGFFFFFTIFMCFIHYAFHKWLTLKDLNIFPFGLICKYFIEYSQKENCHGCRGKDEGVPNVVGLLQSLPIMHCSGL